MVVVVNLMEILGSWVLLLCIHYYYHIANKREMKQKKSEQILLAELSKVQQLAADQRSLAEKKMNSLIKKALSVYKDELDPQLAQVFKSITQPIISTTSSMLEEDETAEQEEPVQLITLEGMNPQQNDKELKDAQVAYENLETSRSIIQNQINKLQGEYDDLQQKLLKIREQKSQWQNHLSRSLKRIADLHSWREDFQEALDVYEQLLKSSINQKETAELHYKIGNVQLLQALPDCESKALKHLQISFQQCVEAQRLELGYYDLNQLKSIQSVRERLTSTYPESEQITLLVLLLEKIEDTLQQQLENRECKQEIERWRNQKFQLDGDSNRLPVTEDRFEKAEPKQVIKLGVFGSAARQRQNVEAYDSVGKRVKQE